MDDNLKAKEKLIRRYKEVHKKKTGEDLTDADALEQALRLVALVKEVYKHSKTE